MKIHELHRYEDINKIVYINCYDAEHGYLSILPDCLTSVDVVQRFRLVNERSLAEPLDLVCFKHILRLLSGGHSGPEAPVRQLTSEMNVGLAFSFRKVH